MGGARQCPETTAIETRLEGGADPDQGSAVQGHGNGRGRSLNGSCTTRGRPHSTAIFAAMREVAHIPHPLMRITVHSYNGQFRLRYELDRYEQSFKYPEAEHTLADVEARAKALSEGVLMRFVDMREQWLQQESST